MAPSWPPRRPRCFQNAILDPIIILASISDPFLIDFGPISIDFQSPRTSKTMKNTLENNEFHYFALFHSGSRKLLFWTRLGPPNPSKIDPETPPGAPKWPQDGVQTVPLSAKMAFKTHKMSSKTAKMPPKCYLRSYHHLSIDF